MSLTPRKAAPYLLHLSQFAKTEIVPRLLPAPSNWHRVQAHLYPSLLVSVHRLPSVLLLPRQHASDFHGTSYSHMSPLTLSHENSSHVRMSILTLCCCVPKFSDNSTSPMCAILPATTLPTLSPEML